MVFSYAKISSIKDVKCCIYKISNLINNKVYIGKTEAPLILRIRRHCAESKKKTNRYLYDAINHYGWDNFSVIIQETCSSKEELNEREIFWISFFKSNNKEFGYNMTPGGDGAPFSEETIKKLADSRRGKPISDEIKKKISDGNKGKTVIITEEQKVRIRETLLTKVDKELIIKYTKEGLLLKEVASKLEVSSNTVRCNIKLYFGFCGFKKLQDFLEVSRYKPNQREKDKQRLSQKVGELNSSYIYINVDNIVSILRAGKISMIDLSKKLNASPYLILSRLKTLNYSGLDDAHWELWLKPKLLYGIEHNFSQVEIRKYCHISGNVLSVRIKQLGYKSLTDARQQLCASISMSTILTKDQISLLRVDFESKLYYSHELCSLYNISKTSLYRYLRG